MISAHRGTVTGTVCFISDKLSLPVNHAAIEKHRAKVAKKVASHEWIATSEHEQSEHCTPLTRAKSMRTESGNGDKGVMHTVMLC